MQDIRLAIRNLISRPSFSAVAILTLALGIGANTAVFTVFSAVLLAPLPYDQPGRVVILNETLLTGTAVSGLPRAQALEVEWPVALFTLALSVTTGVVFGLVPALQATRFDIRESLNEEGRGSSGSARHRRLRDGFVVAEIALALILLVGAGLLLRSFSALTRVSPGFDVARLLVINLPLSPRTYADNVSRTAVVDRLAGLKTRLYVRHPGHPLALCF